jgi:NAD(P)-dependent dehydrogenase (short-subunit alcohol dehydrogenase family)
MDQPADPLFDLQGRTAIVTGASSGLGRRFALCLASRRAQVVAVARRADALKALADAADGRIRPVTGDVTDEKDTQRAVCAALDWTGRLDVLVNNAGVTSVQPAEEESPQLFRHVVDVNLHGLYNYCHHVGRAMIARGSGVIINVASINGLVASWTIPEAGYCASKGAVISLTRELAAQWASSGVRVNALIPGYFRTEMTEDLFSSEAGQRRLRRMPMGRGGNAGELEGPLIFLASDASSYMTGQTLVVDGGWTAV